MLTSDIKKHQFSGLRKRALPMMEAIAISHEDLSQTELKDIIHELHLHQVELDIQNEDLRYTQKELEEARDLYRNLYDFAPVGYVLLSKSGLIKKSNLTFANMLGVERANLKNTVFAKYILKDDATLFYTARHQAQETRNNASCDVRLTDQNSNTLYVKLSISLQIDTIQKGLFFQITISDVSLKMKAQEELSKLLNEKNYYYRKLQTRINNNLALLVSILDIQDSPAEKFSQAVLYREFKLKLYAVKLLHYLLGRNGSFTGVNARDYIEGIIANLLDTLGCYERNIKIDSAVFEVSCDIESLLPCGLVVTEIVNYATQCAFTGREDGTIFIALRKNLNDKYMLTVRDDGIRYRENNSDMNSGNINFSIVRKLVASLRGNMTYSYDGGNIVKIEFIPPWQ